MTCQFLRKSYGHKNEFRLKKMARDLEITNLFLIIPCLDGFLIYRHYTMGYIRMTTALCRKMLGLRGQSNGRQIYVSSPRNPHISQLSYSRKALRFMSKTECGPVGHRHTYTSYLVTRCSLRDKRCVKNCMCSHYKGMSSQRVIWYVQGKVA